MFLQKFWLLVVLQFEILLHWHFNSTEYNKHYSTRSCAFEEGKGRLEKYSPKK